MDKILKSKLENAIAMVAAEEDGSSYLQKVCSMKELKLIQEKAKKGIAKEVISDAITIKKIMQKK